MLKWDEGANGGWKWHFERFQDIMASFDQIGVENLVLRLFVT